MDYDSEIAKEEGVIKQLQSANRSLRTPRRSIDWQFKNARYGNRNPTRQRFLIKRQRKQIINNIQASQNKIISLREALTKSLNMDGVGII